MSIQGILRLQRHELGAAARKHDVGLRVAQHPYISRGVMLVEHVRVVAHDLLDALLVLGGGFLGRGADHLHADLLQRRHHRPGLDAAGDQQHPLAGQRRSW
jgi:hypothetical protein